MKNFSIVKFLFNLIMASTMILFFTICLFLFTFPFQLTMAQSPGAPPASPAPPAPSAPPAPGTAPAPGTPTPTPVAKVPGICNVNDSTPDVNVKLNQIRDKTSAGAEVKIAGTVSYLDGCTFLITGFTYYFAATGS